MTTCNNASIRKCSYGPHESIAVDRKTDYLIATPSLGLTDPEESPEPPRHQLSDVKSIYVLSPLMLDSDGCKLSVLDEKVWTLFSYAVISCLRYGREKGINANCTWL